jgi:hypothetical protein
VIRTVAVLSLVVFAATGCSSLVQVPRAEFASQPLRKNVWIRTQEGTQYAFDRAEFTADSLVGTGYQERTVLAADGQPHIEEVASSVRLPLENIVSLSEKRRDWGRTAKWGLGIGAATAFVVAVGVAKPDDDDAGPGGTKGPPEL